MARSVSSQAIANLSSIPIQGKKSQRNGTDHDIYSYNYDSLLCCLYFYEEKRAVRPKIKPFYSIGSFNVFFCRTSTWDVRSVWWSPLWPIDATSRWLKHWECAWAEVLPDRPEPERRRRWRTWANRWQNMLSFSTAQIRYTSPPAMIGWNQRDQ